MDKLDAEVNPIYWDIRQKVEFLIKITDLCKSTTLTGVRLVPSLSNAISAIR